MVTDHCTLLLAESALSHTSPAITSTSNADGSQADSDINMPLDHLTPGSAPLTPTSLQPNTPQQDHAHVAANGSHGNSFHGDSIYGNIIITPTPPDVPKK